MIADRKLRVAIDASMVGPKITGAGRFLLGLLQHLPLVEPAFEYVALVVDAEAFRKRRLSGVLLHPVLPQSGTHWELRGAADAARDAGADLLFTVREVAPLNSSIPTVVHVFEPPAYRLGVFGRIGAGEIKRYAKDLLLHLSFGNSARRAASVTAGSETTARWLRDRLGIAARTIPPGLDARFHAERVGDPDQPPYILHLASADPRDDTASVLRAIRQAQGLRLVIAGAPDDLRARLAQDSPNTQVEVLGWVSDEKLVELYRGAIAYAHASRYEALGGYPVLEAMALGTPAIVFDAPGVTEAVEGRGIVVPAGDTEAMGMAFDKLLGEPAFRAELGQRCLEYGARLTWEAAARGLAQVFSETLRHPGGDGPSG